MIFKKTTLSSTFLSFFLFYNVLSLSLKQFPWQSRFFFYRDIFDYIMQWFHDEPETVIILLQKVR